MKFVGVYVYPTLFRYNIGRHFIRARRLPGLDKDIMSRTQVLIYSSQYGWVLLRDLPSKHLFLFNLTSFTRIPVPHLDQDYLDFTYALPLPPSHPQCTLVAVHASESYFLVFSINADHQRFTMHEFHNNVDDFCPTGSVVSYNGKVYVKSRVFVVIDPASEPITIKDYHDLRTPVPGVDHYDEQGNIVATSEGLFRVAQRKYIESEVLHSVEVLKLDLAERAWVRVDGIGDRVFFFGDSSSVACSTANLGVDVGAVKRNCIHYTDNTEEQMTWTMEA